MTLFMALLATPTVPGAMTNSDDGRDRALPDELASALRRTIGQSLTALQALRIALREHVLSERTRGATLSEIDEGLRDMINVAGDGDGHSPERIDELRTQVLKWSEGFYSARRK